MNYLGCYSPLLTKGSSYKHLTWTNTWDYTPLMYYRPLLINTQRTNIAPWSPITRANRGLITKLLLRAVRSKMPDSLDLLRRRLTLPVSCRWNQRRFCSTIIRRLGRGQLLTIVTPVTHQEKESPRLNTTRSKVNTVPRRRKRPDSKTTTRWNMSQISTAG